MKSGNRIVRPDFVRDDLDRKMWNSSIHEGGHLLACRLLDVAVQGVFVPLPLTEPNVVPHVTIYGSRSGAPHVTAFVCAAGNGAERSIGRRSRVVSDADRDLFRLALGADGRYPEFVEVAADLFRNDTIAEKLERIAEHIFRRAGERLDTGFLSALSPWSPQDDLLADAALSSLGYPQGRYPSIAERAQAAAAFMELRGCTA